ncbi:divergent polysaccharide deacetylase family protein [Kiloniella sp.]|uniref:divergent polysaccharide deacetylase family protein n=1 Tax=Kiloniella sp. TaxID=1938587 RepID=UPI003B0143E2
MADKRKQKHNELTKRKTTQLKRGFRVGNLSIVLGFVFFLAITVSSILVFQRSDKESLEQKEPIVQTQEQAKIKALEAAPVNKPHPINLGNISVDDTVIDDGSEAETIKLPPSVTVTIPKEAPKKAPEKIIENINLSNQINSSEPDKNTADQIKDEKGSEVASLPPAVQINKSPVPKTTWQRPERPMIAIVLDDVGVNRRGAELAIELPAEITLAFMTYAPGVKELTEKARKNGHELMLHVPMEPLGRADPGPNALLTGLSEEEILSRLEWGMDQFDGYIGINNHMGSKFTGWDLGMQVVMQRIEETDYFFMDSRTSPNSVAASTAATLGVPVLSRDTFLDNDYQNPDTIEAQLKLTEKVAQKNGHAIAIGHPHKTTVKVLHQWIKSAERRGFDVVPISAILALKKPAG